tara:strand:+ start:2035 stop:2247 length:213 start_codon:yes stop_codon:yes gene_type:complete
MTPSKIDTVYGKGSVLNESDNHYWILLDAPILIYNQTISSVPVSKDKAKVLSWNDNSKANTAADEPYEIY